MAAGILLAALALSCDNNEAPQMNDGRIVLRFDPGAGSAVPAVRASVFDSVVVYVDRGRATVNREFSKGVAITDASPVNIEVACIAEHGKRVGVNLYSGRVLA